jgi:tetratricopeptide (TPR) repeat protein
VVFQLEAPRLRDGGPQEAARSPSEAPRPLTEWEKARRELSSQIAEQEKPAPPEPQAPPTRADLVEQLIGLLAENGHNFRRLGPTDRVAIAITFRGSVDPRVNWAVHASAVGETKKANPFQTRSALNAVGETVLRRWIAGAETKEFSDATKREKNEHELAGDLHFRQGQFDKAIEEFLTAIGLAAGSDALKTLDAAKLKADQVSVLEKVAQSLIGAGKYEEAKSLLETIAAWRHLQIGDDTTFLRRAYLDLTGLLPTPDEVRAFLAEKSPDKRRQLIDILVARAAAQAKEEEAEPVLPPRLVVSATKAQLDDVASGKTSREDFRKAVEISYSSPGAPTASDEGGTP